MPENALQHGFGLVPEGTSNVDIDVNMNEYTSSAIGKICRTAIGVAIIIATPFVISLIKGRSPKLTIGNFELSL